jgi:hypothetical protein
MGILFAPAGFSSTFPQLPGPAQLANYDRYNNRVSDGDRNAFYLDCLMAMSDLIRVLPLPLP